MKKHGSPANDDSPWMDVKTSATRTPRMGPLYSRPPALASAEGTVCGVPQQAGAQHAESQASRRIFVIVLEDGPMTEAIEDEDEQRYITGNCSGSRPEAGGCLSEVGGLPRLAR